MDDEARKLDRLRAGRTVDLREVESVIPLHRAQAGLLTIRIEAERRQQVAVEPFRTRRRGDEHGAGGAQPVAQGVGRRGAAEAVADDGVKGAAKVGEVQHRPREERHARGVAFRLPMTRRVEGEDGIAFIQQGLDEGVELAAASAPAVGEEDGRAFAPAPGPKPQASADEVEGAPSAEDGPFCGRRRVARGRREEALRPSPGKLRSDSVRRAEGETERAKFRVHGLLLTRARAVCRAR